jgi:hypothetical protein
MASLTRLGTSGIRKAIMNLTHKNICSMPTNSRTQSLQVVSGAKDCKSLSMAKSAQLVMTEMTEVKLKATNQAPMSRTLRGVGLRVSRQSL